MSVSQGRKFFCARLGLTSPRCRGCLCLKEEEGDTDSVPQVMGAVLGQSQAGSLYVYVVLHFVGAAFWRRRRVKKR